ncbi:MAG: hypothetical protein ACRC2R_18835 [Xenococcaceae cyanobacterium]
MSKQTVPTKLQYATTTQEDLFSSRLRSTTERRSQPASKFEDGKPIIIPIINKDKLERSSSKIRYRRTYRKSFYVDNKISDIEKYIKEKYTFLKLEFYFNRGNKYSIENYFSANLNERAKLRQKYAENIKSEKDIFQILKLGNTYEIQDAYDGAVDLVAECHDEILIKAIDLATHQYLFQASQEQVRAWEKNWEILIKGLSFSSTVPPHEKLSLILRLFLSDGNDRLTRLMKTAIVDALLNLEDEIGADIITTIIERFSSEKRESDEYIRDYAQEAIEDLRDA